VGGAATTINARTRALSFTASAIIVTLVCAALLLMSRVIQLTEDSAIVNVVLEEAPRAAPPPRRQAPQRASGVAIISPNAAPTPTPIPIERGLVQALACMDRFNRERPADCPTTPLAADPGDQERTRRAYDPSPPRVRVALHPLPWASPRHAISECTLQLWAATASAEAPASASAAIRPHLRAALKRFALPAT
jgi:hypothetical protein